MFRLEKHLAAAAAALAFFYPIGSRAGDGVFSGDGNRIYTVAENERGPALREIDLANQTSRTIPLGQLAQTEPVIGITRSPWEKLAVITPKSIWAFDPRSGKLSKIRQISGNNSTFYRIAYNPKTREIYVTSDEGFFVLKNGRDLVSVYVRRHAGIGSLVFTANGDLFYSYQGDLWRGQIEVEEGRYSLTADRYAPLADPETANTTPAESGVRDIAISRDTIYVHLARLGGSGWGWLAQLARPPVRSDSSSTSDAPFKPGQPITMYKAALDSAKILLENSHPMCLCASPDESRVYYTTHTEANQNEDWLITNGQAQQLHLRSE